MNSEHAASALQPELSTPSAADVQAPLRGLVVHEWMASIGGSEKVVESMMCSFPGSDLFCLWRDPELGLPAEWNVVESSLSGSFLTRSKVAALPAMPLVWRCGVEEVERPDFVLISSHLFAHHFRLQDSWRVPKLVYVHTPARYIWAPEYDPRGQSLAAKAASLLLKPLDRMRAGEPQAIVSNSEFVRTRVREAWRRESDVIFPPVEVTAIQSVSNWAEMLSPEESEILDALPSEFLLGASRFVQYKGLDFILQVGVELKMPVVLAGSGPDEHRLRQIAASLGIENYIIQRPSDGLLRSLYQRASLFVFPSIEDFGIMPIEAMAAGTPVIANCVGGTAETVVPGVSGGTFSTSSMQSVRKAAEAALAIEPHGIREWSKSFSRERFEKDIKEWVEMQVADFVPVRR